MTSGGPGAGDTRADTDDVAPLSPLEAGVPPDSSGRAPASCLIAGRDGAAVEAAPDHPKGSAAESPIHPPTERRQPQPLRRTSELTTSGLSQPA